MEWKQQLATAPIGWPKHPSLPLQGLRARRAPHSDLGDASHSIVSTEGLQSSYGPTSQEQNLIICGAGEESSHLLRSPYRAFQPQPCHCTMRATSPAQAAMPALCAQSGCRPVPPPGCTSLPAHHCSLCITCSCNYPRADSPGTVL